MVGSRHEPEQLLELLEAAASKLKAAQSELRVERAKRQQLQEKVDRLQSSQTRVGEPASAKQLLDRLVVVAPGAMHPVIENTTGIPPVDDAVLRLRNRTLTEELALAKTTEGTLRERLAQVEAQHAEALKSLAALRAGASSTAESARVLKLVRQLNSTSKELSAAREALANQQASPPMPAPSTEVSDPALEQRVQQLEGELAMLRSRRDDLNVELARVENDRKLARGRVAELELEAARHREAFELEKRAALADEAAKRVKAEASLEKERQGHQTMALKMLDARQKIRDLENAAMQLTNRANGLEAQLTQTSGQLEAATVEWKHVEREYERLHREMLAMLDQRDEARRELKALKSRLGIPLQ